VGELRRPYERDVELATAMVTCRVHENADGTIFLHFENEHGEYGLTVDVREAAELRATIAAAESSIRYLRGH
jgi:hypothetical protein